MITMKRSGEEDSPPSVLKQTSSAPHPLCHSKIAGGALLDCSVRQIVALRRKIGDVRAPGRDHARRQKGIGQHRPCIVATSSGNQPAKMARGNSISDARFAPTRQSIALCCSNEKSRRRTRSRHSKESPTRRQSQRPWLSRLVLRAARVAPATVVAHLERSAKKSAIIEKLRFDYPRAIHHKKDVRGIPIQDRDAKRQRRFNRGEGK